LVLQVSDHSGKAISPLFFAAANTERLREVIMNLIENAYKFTSEGGIKVTLGGTNKEVSVAISDSGVGIAPEDIKHLFQKFYRIDNSATRTIGGTGLGLYLCRKVIESYNGRIWIESKPNVGSTFKFTLPRLSLEEAEQMQAANGPVATVQPAGLIQTPAGTPAAGAPSSWVAPVPAAVVMVAKPPAAVAMPIPEAFDQAVDVSAPAPITSSAAPAERANVTDITRRVN
jgi:anti-sigma regulatory factor (Ser/Thr protein kinase)